MAACKQESPRNSGRVAKRERRLGKPRTSRITKGLALVIPLGLAATTGVSARDDFGRWQGGLQNCQIRQEGQNGWHCQRLEVVQTSDQVLSLRFVRSQDSQQDHRRLQLIGTVKEGEGLDCNPNGCQLTPQLNLVVTGLSTMQFDGRGLARATPLGAVARGTCQWLNRQLRCRFSAGAGGAWTIQASL